MTASISLLFRLSFLMMFTELFLIRWSGSNIAFLSLFSNLILLASFLGIGIGFLRKSTSKSLFSLAPIFLAALVFLCYEFRYEYQIILNATGQDLSYNSKVFSNNLLPLWMSIPLIFVMVTMVMMSIADGVARVFQCLAPLQAYRFDILGSLFGIIVFSMLAFFQAPPLVWGILIGFLFVSLNFEAYKNKKNWFMTILHLLSLLIMLGALYQESTGMYAWSSYYKINPVPYLDNRYAVNVNGLPQQFIESVSQRKIYKPFYFSPYQDRNNQLPLNHVLIIGAGTGGDVAIALANGAKQVDAIEIDPVLYQLGTKLNPDHVYDDKRVNVLIGDGRAFLQQSRKQYDLIILALTDSVMVLSGQSSVRLESYLYTLEGISAARDHLTDQGVFAMYNYYREKWTVDRFANTLSQVFHATPCVATEGEENMWLSALTIGKQPSNVKCRVYWQNPQSAYQEPTTDNHPFMYLKSNQLSGWYVALMLFIVSFSLFMIKKTGCSLKSLFPYTDLFLMGVGFLLLETKNIAQFALLFGSTWFVNALVFTGILLTIYLSIEVVHRFKFANTLLLPVLLVASLTLGWFVPTSFLLILPIWLRFFAAVSLAFAPIFIANLIFARRFSETADSREAFGANMLGAVAGGLLEYVSIVIGFNNLLIVIAVLYVLAVIHMRYRFNQVGYASAAV